MRSRLCIIGVLLVVGEGLSGCTKAEIKQGSARQPASVPNQASESLGDELNRIHAIFAGAPASQRWVRVSPSRVSIELEGLASAASSRQLQLLDQPLRLAMARGSNEALREAIRREDLRAAELAVGAGADVHSQNSSDGSTPLHWAAYHGQTGIMQLLISKGAAIDARTSYQRTPLHWAALNGRSDAIALLLEMGADPLAVDKAGATPLNLAGATLAFNRENPQSQLSVDLLQAHWKLDAAQNEIGGKPALLWAAREGKVHLAQRLIDMGADVNARDEEGRTPLHAAVLDEKAEVIKLLLERGADPNAKDPYGLTPIFEVKSTVAAEMLLAHGAKLDVRDKTDQTPLHWAAAYGQGTVVQLFIAKGADVNAKDKFGRTAADVDREEAHGQLAGVWGNRP